MCHMPKPHASEMQVYCVLADSEVTSENVRIRFQIARSQHLFTSLSICSAASGFQLRAARRQKQIKNFMLENIHKLVTNAICHNFVLKSSVYIFVECHIYIYIYIYTI